MNHKAISIEINWAALSILIVILLSVVGWCTSIEVRLAQQAETINLSNRVTNIEDLLFPMLVDWKTHQKIKEWQEKNINAIGNHASTTHGDEMPQATEPIDILSDITSNAQHDAYNWAAQALPTMSKQKK